MNSRLLLTCLVATITTVRTFGADTAGANASKPNVVFLLTDDLRADAIGALGNRVVKTPNMDRLAERGFVFRNAYCLGSNSPAVCQPSRNMILSGNAYFRWRGERNAPASGPSLPRSMEKAGYATFHAGKKGNVAVEIQKLFQTNKVLDDQKERTSGEPGKAVVNHATDWLDSRRSDQRPFFMYLAFEAPHDPRVPSASDRKIYQNLTIPLPKNYLPVHPFDNGEMTIRDEQLAPWPRPKDEIQKHLEDYYAVITGLDLQIGRLVDDLKARGEWERTIFVLSSDHGLAIGSHGLMGKQSLYDHSMKSPLIFAGPGIPKGESSALVYLLDIFPTIVDLVGAAPLKNIDGRSLAPILRDPTAKVRDDLFLAYRDVQRAVRDDNYKLIVYPKINRTQLFDLTNDPEEMNDLSKDPAEADRIAAMTMNLEMFQKDYGDDDPLIVVHPADGTFTPPKE
jgi:arylsulfatase A-like enzyme